MKKWAKEENLTGEERCEKEEKERKFTMRERGGGERERERERENTIHKRKVRK